MPCHPATLPACWLQMGETPLIRAAHNGHLQTVRFLLEKGADVNSVDMVGPWLAGGPSWWGLAT